MAPSKEDKILALWERLDGYRLVSSCEPRVRAEVGLANAGEKSSETGQVLPTHLTAMCNVASYVDRNLNNLNKYEHSWVD